jgi:hypothetical protein
MKKEELRAALRALEYKFEDQCAQTASERRRNAALADENETMRANWRPVPITHEWQPRNPQCALCNEPRDSARHRVAVQESVVPPE